MSKLTHKRSVEIALAELGIRYDELKNPRENADLGFKALGMNPNRVRSGNDQLLRERNDDYYIARLVAEVEARAGDAQPATRIDDGRVVRMDEPDAGAPKSPRQAFVQRQRDAWKTR